MEVVGEGEPYKLVKRERKRRRGCLADSNTHRERERVRVCGNVNQQFLRWSGLVLQVNGRFWIFG